MTYKFPRGDELGARLRPGLYYSLQGATTTAATTLDRLYAVPFFIPRYVTLDRIAINVTVAAATGGSEAKLGIYADIDDEYGGFPGALVSGSTGSVATNAIAFVAATISLTLNPGLYWLALVTQTSVCTVTCLTGGNQAVGHNQDASVSNRNHYGQSSVSGALPATFAGTANAQGNAPAISVRVA